MMSGTVKGAGRDVALGYRKILVLVDIDTVAQ